jgi:hypothetical protein
VPSESRHYVKARVAAANLHLEHRKDKKLFLRCFEDLVAGRHRSAATLALKAEAHLRLQARPPATPPYTHNLLLSDRREYLTGFGE